MNSYLTDRTLNFTWQLSIELSIIEFFIKISQIQFLAILVIFINKI